MSDDPKDTTLLEELKKMRDFHRKNDDLKGAMLHANLLDRAIMRIEELERCNDILTELLK